MTKQHKFALLTSIITASIVILIIAPMLLHKNIMSVDELKVNTAPKFEVGQTFSYLRTNRIRSDGSFYYDEERFVVNDTREINGRMYYEVIWNTTHFTGDPDESNPNEIKVRTYSTIEIFYYDAENGTCLMRRLDSSEFKNRDSYAGYAGFFTYWMLCLKEDLAWKIDNPDFPPEMAMTLFDAEFTVVGQENVSGIMCFKVRLQTIAKGAVYETLYYWIDAEKRIMIKQETSPGFYKYLIN